MMAAFADLPAELIHHIVSILALQESPSSRYLHEEPSILLLDSVHRPLKNLSRTCRVLHDHCFPCLFSALKANIQDTSNFAAFVQQHVLIENVKSLVIYSMKSNNRTLINGSPRNDNSFNISTWPLVLSLLDQINPRSLTFVLPPAAYEDLLPYKLALEDDWAFNISYQVLHLKQSLDDTQSSSTAIPTTTPNIFLARPWNHMTFNEGSSIPAYCTYEYFHKNTPSLLMSQQIWLFPINMSAQITSFDLVGIFPMDISSACTFLIGVRSLRRLRTQLAPGASNHIMDDSRSLGKCQREDLWSEFAQCYRTLSFVIKQGQSQGTYAQLEQFVALDYATTGLRDIIDRSVILEPSEWDFDDHGCWTRIRRHSSIDSHADSNIT